ncbi:MAG TPA: HupE/UreJ family protein [Gemmatimonadales bacterium]
MSGFGVFVGLGFHHVTDLSALDHLLFLVALAASYRWADWRHLLGVATAFTLGHSITLALVVTDLVRLPTPLIEFLIPVTIVGACLANLRRPGARPSGWARPALAAGFGLIHGAGFANFLREMFEGPAAGPLLAFNLGIETGQVVILALALALLSALDRLLDLWSSSRGFAHRAIATSVLAGVWAATMASGRLPW